MVLVNGRVVVIGGMLSCMVAFWQGNVRGKAEMSGVAGGQPTLATMTWATPNSSASLSEHRRPRATCLERPRMQERVGHHRRRGLHRTAAALQEFPPLLLPPEVRRAITHWMTDARIGTRTGMPKGTD
jgi:hypothetical protein